MMTGKSKFNRKIQFFKNLLILKMTVDYQKIREKLAVNLRY
jgi:hypothetical protein